MLNNISHQKASPIQENTILAKRYQIQKTIKINNLNTYYLARDLHFPRVKHLVFLKEVKVKSMKTSLSYELELQELEVLVQI